MFASLSNCLHVTHCFGILERLSTSKYGNDGDIKTMVEVFDKAVKPIFKESNENSFIKFGSLACNDLQVKIRRGQLALTGCVCELAVSHIPS